MAGMIATLLSGAKVLNSNDNNGPLRHAYNEIVDLQSVNDPELASPYLLATAVSSIAATAGSSGNFTITLNFPKYSVAKTTANVVYNADAAAIQSAIDTALSGETILSTYSNGDVDAAVTGNVSANAAAITANGTSVNGTHMVVTTTNVDLDVAAPAVTVTTVGTMNRPAEAVLAYYGIIQPVSSVVPQGISVTVSDYQVPATNENPFSLSPGLKDVLVRELAYEQDDLAVEFRRLIGCV